MAETIKGINVVIGAETTGLAKTLEDVNKKAKDIQSELKQVDRLLKFDPSNTELLAQKKKLLADAVANARERLDRLRAVQEQVNEQFRRGEISEGQYRAFQREVAKAEQDLRKFETQLRQTGITAEQVGQKLESVGKKMTDVGKNLSAKVTTPLVGLGAVATKLGMDFEAAMSEVAAISGATGEDLAKLEALAKEMGATTKFSASEAAEGLKYMAMAGWDTQQMLEGLPGVLSLAAASGEDLGRVSDIVTDALTAFGMQASEAGKFADILAAASSNANTNVGMLGESFKYVAPVFGSLGYSAEDAALALGLMANAGIKASQAGTALRGAITRMVKPTGDAAKLMKQLGISMTDAEGNMLPFRDVMEQLREAFSKLSAEQQAQYAATIFGQEAMSGMLAIINASEADYNKLASAIDNSTGAADRMAKQMQDNLKGRLTELKSALEGVALQLYDHLQPALEKLIEIVRKVVDWFAKLSPEAQKVIVAIAAIAAAIGPLLVVLGTMAGSISAIIGVLPLLGKALAALTGPVGLVIAAVTALIAIWATWGDDIKRIASEVVTRVTEWFGSFRDKVAELWTNIQVKTTEIWTSVSTFLETVWNNIKTTAEVIWNAIKTAIETITLAIQTILTTIWTAIKNFLEPLWEALRLIAEIIWLAMKIAIQTATEAIQAVLVNIWTAIKNFLEPLWTGLKTAAETIFNAMRAVIEAATQAIQTVITSIWTAIKGFLEPLWNSLKELANTLFTAIKDAIKTAFEKAEQAIQEIWTRIKSWISQTWESIKKIFTDSFGTLYKIGKDMFSSIWDGMKEIWDRISRWVSEKVEWILDKLRSWRDALREMASGGSSSGSGGSSTNLAGSSSASTGKPAKFAEGGIVTKPTLAWIGEAGFSEAVIPLPRLQPMLTAALTEALERLEEKITSAPPTSGRPEIKQYITIQSPTPLSPSEVARQVKNASRQLAMEW